MSISIFHRHAIWLLVCSAFVFLGHSGFVEDKAATAPKSQRHVYLLIGQSNMAGRAKFSDDDAKPVPKCYLLNAQNKWEEARNPLNQYSTIRKNLKMQAMGPGYSFAKTMLKKEQDITLGLVVNAKGSTKIAQWKKGTKFYDKAIQRTKIAMKTGTLKGILWHQGEGDSKKSPTYLKSLEQLISDLRKDLGMPKLPFIAGEVFYHPTHKPHTAKINQQISLLPKQVSFTATVSSKELTTHDNTHFDTKGVKKLGQRYAEAMLTLQAEANEK